MRELEKHIFLKKVQLDIINIVDRSNVVNKNDIKKKIKEYFKSVWSI